MIRIILVLAGYVFGMFQTGWFYGKAVGVDLTKEGSGNTGATNALRVMGLKGGLTVYLFDALKAFIPCFLVCHVIRWKGANVSDVTPYMYMMYTALGVILGNDFPCWLKGRGGKGVAATSGWTLAWNPVIWLFGMGLFFAIAFLTKIVSVASITISFVVIALAFAFGQYKWAPAAFTGQCWEFYIIVIFLQLLMICRHKDNIVRLINGTENRFGKKKERK